MDDTIKKLYLFKLNSYSGVFTTLIFLQIISIILAFNSGEMSVGFDIFEVKINYYSASSVFVLTMLWGFITAFLLTTKGYRHADFMFVTNRLTSHLANGLFLLTMSFLGSLTASLSPFLIRVIIFIYQDEGHITEDFLMSAQAHEFIIGFAAAFLYLLVFSVLGYLFGMLIQSNKALQVIILVVFLGGLMINSGEQGMIISIINFFMMESSFVLFTLKMIVSILMIYLSTILLTNKMEVIR